MLSYLDDVHHHFRRWETFQDARELIKKDEEGHLNFELI